MRYQEHPEPEALITAFKFGVANREIAAAGSRNLVVAFFGSLFRADSTLINLFYKEISRKNSSNLHYGFVGSLWMADTPYGQKTLEKYLQLESSKKYKNDGFQNEHPFNIYRDAITAASQLDLIWADFFATGNPADIKRIASTLDADGSVAEAAQWSLISNGIRYKKVRQELLMELANNESSTLRQKLSVVKIAIEGELLK